MQTHIPKGDTMVHFNLMIEMHAKGLTNEKLARFLNLSEQEFLAKMEGKRKFSEHEIKHLMIFFPYCSRDYIFQKNLK
jgi:hypothetical protein